MTGYGVRWSGETFVRDSVVPGTYYLLVPGPWYLTLGFKKYIRCFHVFLRANYSAY